MPVFILFIFIELFGIPMLVTGILLKLSPDSRSASRYQSLYLTLIIAGISLLFLLPIKIFSFFYFTFLMCVVGVLLVVYFFVKVHGNDIKANLKVYGSMLALVTAGTLAAIFVALMPGDEEQYNYAAAHQLARALHMRRVESNVIFRDADLYIKGDTVIGKSNYLALPPPVFKPRGKIFYHLLSQPGVFHVIKPHGILLQGSDVDAEALSPVCFRNKMLLLYLRGGEITQMDMSGQLGKTSVQVGSLTSGGYLFYKDKAITHDNDGV